MASTTDFEEWLENNEPDGHEQAMALYYAARGQPGGEYLYEVSENDGKRFIKGPDGTTLVLASPKAIAAFQRRIDDYKDDPEMDWGSWYGYKVAMAKED